MGSQVADRVPRGGLWNGRGFLEDFNIGPGDADSFACTVERIEARLGIHPGIDQHPAVGKANQIDVYDAE